MKNDFTLMNYRLRGTARLAVDSAALSTLSSPLPG